MTCTDAVIAVVDDETPVRNMLGRLLRLAGYQASPYASGDAFLASLAGQRPACVILDIHMPGLSGFDVLARLRESRATVPVVFITASDDAALADAALAAGGVRLLRKPFSNEALLSAVDFALGSDRVCARSRGRAAPGSD